MPTPAPEPTTFDWWAGIFLPSITGMLSLVLAGVSLWIAIHALRVAADANALALEIHRTERRDERKATALALNAVWQQAGRSWINAKEHDLSDVMPLILEQTNTHAITGDKGADSMIWQIMQWHGQIFSTPTPDRDRQRRIDFMIAVGQDWKLALEEYVADDSGEWTMPMSTAKY